MPRIVHDTLELLHRLQKFHDRIPVHDFLGKDIAAAQGTEITAAAGTFACSLCQIQEAAVSEIRAFVEMTLIAAGQETFRPVSFAPVVFLDEPVLLVHDRIIGKHLHGLYPGTVNGFVFRRRHRVQFRQLDLEGYRNVRILVVKVDFMFRMARNFYIGPMTTFDYVYGHDFEKPELWKGMKARSTNVSLGFSLLYDSRDFLTNAYKGYYLRIDQRFSPAFLGNKYAFSNTELTTSYYQSVWKGGVLAGQFHTLLNYGNPPWGLMATLGSSYSMRGYYEGRYRDKCAMDVQLELRQHVWKRNGVAVWVGAGTIFPNFSELEARHILPNYGFGYRWEFKKRVNVRLDLGFGKHQTGFIFNINEAF